MVDVRIHCFDDLLLLARSVLAHLLLSFIPLVVIQQRVNAINAACAPDVEINSRLSGLNIICIVLGGGALLLIVIGTFVD